MNRGVILIASMLTTSGIVSAAVITEENTANARGVVHSGLNISEIEKMTLEGLPRIDSARGRDIIILLGNTGSGKSTIVNYLFGINMKKGKRGTERFAIPLDSSGQSLLDEEGNVRDCTQIPAVMAHPGEMKSCTLFPQACSNEASSCVLLDGQGFGEDRGPEGSVVASVITEMAAKRAKSIRIAVVIPKGDITRDGRVRLKSVCLTIHKLLRVTGDQLPVGFIINKADNDDEPNDIRQTAIDIIKGERDSTSKMLATRTGKKDFKLEHDTIPDALKNDPEVKQRLEMIEAMETLDFMAKSQKIFIPDIFDSGRGRQSLQAFLGSLSAVPLESFRFGGYSDARTKFNDVLVRMASDGLKVLRAKASLARHIETINQFHQEEENYAALCLSNITENNYEGVVAEERRRVAELEQGILNHREKIAELKGIKKALEEDQTKVEHWTDSWNLKWNVFFLWWRNYQVRYHGSWFDDYEIDTSSGTHILSNNSSTDKKKGVFDRDFASDAGNDCKGEVILYRYKCNTTSQKDTIRSRVSEIEALTRHIEQSKQDIGRASQKSTDASGLRTEYERKAREAQAKANEWGKVLSVSEWVDRTYKERKESVDQTYSIIKVLGFRQDDNVVEEFVKFYDQFQILMERNEIELPNSLVDPITFSPLLHAVQTRCGHVFNRLSIELHLERSKTCPSCRAPVKECDLMDVPHINRVTGEYLEPMTRDIGEARAHAEALGNVTQ